MSDSGEPKERLAALLVADVVGYSRLMRDDQRATLTTLDEYRAVFRQKIEAHGGRIVDMAGDSILAVFETATGAVQAADEAQTALVQHNAALPEGRQMRFRVGVNLGDILEKEDGTVYGDGLNVAARLEALANPGGINISGSVFDSVRAKVTGPFVCLGEHELKNIADPVVVYATGATADVPKKQERHAQPVGAESTARPTLTVIPFKVISGNAETESLAEGLYQDIVGGLTKQTAIDVMSDSAGDDATTGSDEGAGFRLTGSVRSAGERLRMTFTLVDTHAGHQVWSERYDRHLENIFDLEDEISQNVASAVRLRIKARAFEILHDTDDEALSVPELLSKAAGYFVSSSGHNEEAAATLQVALEREPENSMANAMMVFCRYRSYEFNVYDIPHDVTEDLTSQIHRALSEDASSYFAHLIAAVVHQDLKGDFDTALVHAETALELNPGFSQATAMVGVARIHMGDAEQGFEKLYSGISSAPEDPHRFRHLRELAIGHFISGDMHEAATAIDKLIHQAPGLLRNQLVAAPILLCAGREDEARLRIEDLLRDHPDLTQRNMRRVRFRDATSAAQFSESLTAVGVPA